MSNKIPFYPEVLVEDFSDIKHITPSFFGAMTILRIKDNQNIWRELLFKQTVRVHPSLPNPESAKEEAVKKLHTSVYLHQIMFIAPEVGTSKNIYGEEMYPVSRTQEEEKDRLKRIYQ